MAGMVVAWWIVAFLTVKIFSTRLQINSQQCTSLMLLSFNLKSCSVSVVDGAYPAPQ